MFKLSISLRIFSTFISYMRSVNIAIVCYVVASLLACSYGGPSNEKGESYVK